MNSINSNPVSLMAQRALASNQRSMSSVFEKLATGMRINRGADDPAGLIASEQLRASLEVLEAETRAMERADQVISRADAALGEVSDLLVEAEGLAVANANTAGMSDAEREANQMELDSIRNAIDRIASSTTFNGDRLLDGSATINVAGESITIGSSFARDLGQVEIDGQAYSFDDTASGGGLNIVDGDISGAAQSISAAQEQIATLRGRLGAFSKNTIGPGMRAAAVGIENLSAAESIIRDTDVAKQIAALSREQVLAQGSMGALAFGVSAPASALMALGQAAS